MLLSVIVPVFNEEKHLARFVEHLLHTPCILEREIIFINDGSTDTTLSILAKEKEKYSFRLLNQEKHQGKGAAVIAGIKVSQGDIIMIQDADFEYNVNEINNLLLPIINRQSDVVFGSRFKSLDGRKLTYHYFINRGLTFLSNLFSGTYLTDMETCYKIFRADILKNMNLKSKRFGIEVEMTAYLAKGHYHIIELPISFNPRTKKEGKKIGWRDGVAALYHLLYFNFYISKDQAYLKSNLVPFKQSLPNSCRPLVEESVRQIRAKLK